MIFVGLRTISSGELSILTFMNPLLVVILGTFLLKIIDSSMTVDRGNTRFCGCLYHIRSSFLV